MRDDGEDCYACGTPVVPGVCHDEILIGVEPFGIQVLRGFMFYAIFLKKVLESVAEIIWEVSVPPSCKFRVHTLCVLQERQDPVGVFFTSAGIEKYLSPGSKVWDLVIASIN